MATKRKRITRSRPAPKAAKPITDRPTFAAPERERLEYMPGQYFVRVHPEAVRPYVGASVRPPTGRDGAMRIAFTADTAASVPDAVVEPLEYLRSNVGLKDVRPLFADAGRTRLSRASVSARQRDSLALVAAVATEEDDELSGIAIAELDPKASAATIRRAEAANAFDYIEPVPARWLAAATRSDPLENLQWGLRSIRWFDAARPAAHSVGVGILDTGIDKGHPDLSGVEVDYHHTGTRAEDIVGHGTHVAGIVAAETNNDIGIAGIASCSLQIWKVFSDKPFEGQYYVDPDLFADALRDASRSGLSAVNMSLGGTRTSRPEQLLIRRLLDRGVAVIAAMGNEYEYGNPTEYPAAYGGVLAVGAIAENRERSSFSNTGSHIGICAPGSNILSTLPRRKSTYRPERMYAAWSGTSMATPHVAAAAALVAAKKPHFSGKDIQQHLRSTATKLPAMGRKSRTNEYGDGLLDLKRALS